MKRPLQQEMRIQKFLSLAGIASRREAEKLVLAGRVQVNDRQVLELGTRVVPDRDIIALDNQAISLHGEHLYLLLHKPAGYLTTSKDPQRRATVFDLIPESRNRHLFTVGRLDKDTEGILLVTSDGELASRLMHPRFEIPKSYLVLTRGIVSSAKLKLLRSGINLEEGKTAPAQASRVKIEKNNNKTWLKITVHEGKKRQIKRMCRAIGHPVIYLQRASFAFLKLGHLATGAYRSLSREEVQKLRSIVQLKEYHL